LKFKRLMLLYSIIITIAILTAAVLPVVMAGAEFAVYIKSLTLPLILFIVLLLSCMMVFFLLNYRLFSLLEKEDWPALSYYLEKKIYTKGRYSAAKVRILASSYLVILDYASVFKLENKAKLARPSVIDKNALIFGTAKILSGNHKEAAEFFWAHREKCRADERQWVRWFYGFSLLLCGVFNKAEQEFSSLAISSKDAIICGLSAYFLFAYIASHSKNHEECVNIAEKGKARVIKKLKKADRWEKEAAKIGDEIHTAIIKKYVDEAGKWLFEFEQAEQGNL